AGTRTEPISPPSQLPWTGSSVVLVYHKNAAHSRTQRKKRCKINGSHVWDGPPLWGLEFGCGSYRHLTANRSQMPAAQAGISAHKTARIWRTVQSIDKVSEERGLNQK